MKPMLARPHRPNAWFAPGDEHGTKARERSSTPQALPDGGTIERSKDRKSEPPAPIASLLTISSTFDSLFKVLFTFPSRYLFAIGLSLSIFSLGWDLPPA